MQRTEALVGHLHSFLQLQHICCYQAVRQHFQRSFLLGCSNCKRLYLASIKLHLHTSCCPAYNSPANYVSITPILQKGMLKRRSCNMPKGALALHYPETKKRKGARILAAAASPLPSQGWHKHGVGGCCYGDAALYG